MSQVKPAGLQVSVLQAVLLVLFFWLFFYQWGAANLQGFLNYPMMRDMGELVKTEEFIRLRVDVTAKIFPLLVIPFALSILSTIALTIFAPQFIPRRVLFIILGLQAIIATSTIFIDAPIQFQLNEVGHDMALHVRLISTDFWLRKVPLQIEGGFVLYVLWRVVAR